MPELKTTAVPSLAARLESARERLMAMNESEAVGFFQLRDFKLLLKTTVSLCPECLGHVPALVFTREELDRQFLRT